MELNEQITIHANRADTFAALNDPRILEQAIPGCESFEAISPTEFKATVTSKVGPLVARFTGVVRLSDVVAPERFTLTGEGKAGPVGFAKVSAEVILREDGSATRLAYKVKADIGGKLGQLGGGMIERTSKKLSGEFFGRLEELMESDRSRKSEVVEVPLRVSQAAPISSRRSAYIGAAAVLGIAAIALAYRFIG